MKKRTQIRKLNLKFYKVHQFYLYCFWYTSDFCLFKSKNNIQNSQIKIFSYIDEVTVTVKNKSVEENNIMLKKIVKLLFLWAKNNAVVFNDSKTELIYFNKNKKNS